MLSVRGNSNKVYLERSGVPYSEVIETVVKQRSIKYALNCFPITKEELFQVLHHYCENADSSNAMLELNISMLDDETFSVVTTGINDWTYLSCLVEGHIEHPESLDVNHLYTSGLEKVVKDIMVDLYRQDTAYTASELHMIVYKAIVDAYGPLDKPDIELMLMSIGINPEDIK